MELIRVSIVLTCVHMVLVFVLKLVKLDLHSCSKKCAICTKSTLKQCIRTKKSDINNECYSYCSKATNRKCDGNYASCLFIPSCGPGARCNAKSKKCECEAGYTGNGQQCFSGDCSTGCDLVTDPSLNIQV